VASDGLARPQKKAEREGRIIVFVDEAGFYLLPGQVRTYAPRGHTPLLRWCQSRDHLSVMSGVTRAGKLYTLVRDRALDSADSVHFLQHLRQQASRDVLVIWDGSPIHRGREVTDFLAQGGAPAIHLEALPPYAPELNPDEGVWEHLKQVELGNLSCANLSHLQRELDLALMRLRSKPRLVRSFFARAGLS
jgi:transposase